MIVRKKTRRRLALAALVILLCLSAAIGSVVLRRQSQREYAALRQQGMAAFHQGDFAVAIARLGQYLERNRTDAEALLHAARARRLAPLPGDRHLAAAMGMYRRYLEIDPGHVGALRELALLYDQLGFSREAVEAASGVLAQAPGDRDALRVSANGLAAVRSFREALVVADRAVAVDPLDVEMRMLALHLCRQIGRTSNILPRALAFHEDHPGDPHALLLLGVACVLVEQVPSADAAALATILEKPADAALNARDLAAAFILRAAQDAPADPWFIHVVITQLDGLAMSLEATRVLLRMADATEDPVLKHDLIRRLFEVGWHAELAGQTAALPMTIADESDVDPLAMRAVALADTGRGEEAAAIARRLREEKHDPQAQAWAAVIEAILAPPDRRPLAGVVAAVQEAHRVRRAGVHVRFYHAEALAGMHENGRAIRAFREIVEQAPLWHRPRLRLSQLLLHEEKHPEALEAARTAAGLSPGLNEMVNLAFVLAAQPKGTQLGDGIGLLQLLEEIQRMTPGEMQTLPMYVRSLAEAGRVDEARQQVRATLERADPPKLLLLQLAAVSREASLGLEEACFSRAEALHGRTPDWAYARALHLAITGRADEGAQLLEKTAPRDPDLAWRLTWARYRDQMNDPRAVEAWKALADDPAHGGDLAIQLAALASPSAHNDPAFLQRTVDRVRAITGEEAIAWRIARARLLARPDASAEQLSEAAALLNRAVELVPDDPAPRQLLAVVQSQQGQTTNAIEQLKAVLQLQPHSTGTMLQLIHLHQERADFELARERLLRFDPANLPPEHHRRLAELWLRQGEIGSAITALERAKPLSNDDRLLLAGLYHRANRRPQAQRLLDELLKAPTAPIIAAAADFHAACGRADEADALLTQLGRLNLPPGQGELTRARHYAAFGTPSQAQNEYRAALAASPGDAAIWKELIQLLLRTRGPAPALEAVAEALNAVPSDRGLKAFHARAALIADVGREPEVAEVAAAVLYDDTTRAAMDMLTILSEGRRNAWPKALVAERLRKVADRTLRLEPLQALTVHYYSAAGRPEEAIFVARRAATHVPSSARIAEAAAEAFAAAEDWNQALTAAMRWRQLSLENPVRADLFISRVHLRAARSSAARQYVEPYLRNAIANPEQNICILAQQARILIFEGRADEAARLLWPATEFAQYRRLWCRLAMQMTDAPATAAAWLERIADTIPADDLEGRIFLARSWDTFGQASGQRQHRDRALALMRGWSAEATAPAPLLLALATLLEEQEQPAEAEQVYRQVLFLEPNHAAARNNLASLILDRNGDAAEAAELARHAVAAKPANASFHDTLAIAYARLGQNDHAVESMRHAVRLEPDNPRWQIGLAMLYAQTGQLDQARSVLAELKAVSPRENRLPEDLRQRLRELDDAIAQRIGIRL